MPWNIFYLCRLEAFGVLLLAAFVAALPIGTDGRSLSQSLTKFNKHELAPQLRLSSKTSDKSSDSVEDSSGYRSKHLFRLLSLRACRRHGNCSDFGLPETETDSSKVVDSASMEDDKMCRFAEIAIHIYLSDCQSVTVSSKNCSSPVPGSRTSCSHCTPMLAPVDVFFACVETGIAIQKARSVMVDKDCHCV